VSNHLNILLSNLDRAAVPIYFPSESSIETSSINDSKCWISISNNSFPFCAARISVTSRTRTDPIFESSINSNNSPGNIQIGHSWQRWSYANFSWLLCWENSEVQKMLAWELNAGEISDATDQVLRKTRWKAQSSGFSILSIPLRRMPHKTAPLFSVNMKIPRSSPSKSKFSCKWLCLKLKRKMDLFKGRERW